GFARRAASYKRADFIFGDPARIEPLLAGRRVQLVFAGKAHPDDAEGKQLVATLVNASRRYAGAVVFVPDYSMALARRLTRGVGGGRAEHAAPPAGGVRDLGHEGGAQRRPQLLGARRLVGRGVPARRERLGDRGGPRTGSGARPRVALPDPRGGGPAGIRGPRTLARDDGGEHRDRPGGGRPGPR